MRNLFVLLIPLPFLSNARHTLIGDPFSHTFSIVARDERTGDLAVGVVEPHDGIANG